MNKQIWQIPAHKWGRETVWPNKKVTAWIYYAIKIQLQWWICPSCFSWLPTFNVWPDSYYLIFYKITYFKTLLRSQCKMFPPLRPITAYTDSVWLKNRDWIGFISLEHSLQSSRSVQFSYTVIIQYYKHNGPK